MPRARSTAGSKRAAGGRRCEGKIARRGNACGRNSTASVVLRDGGLTAEDQLLRIALQAAHRPANVVDGLASLDREGLVVAQPRAGEARDARGDLGGALVEIVGEDADRARGLPDLLEGGLALLAGRRAEEVLRRLQHAIDPVGGLVELFREL